MNSEVSKTKCIHCYLSLNKTPLGLLQAYVYVAFEVNNKQLGNYRKYPTDTFPVFIICGRVYSTKFRVLRK